MNQVFQLPAVDSTCAESRSVMSRNRRRGNCFFIFSVLSHKFIPWRKAMHSTVNKRQLWVNKQSFAGNGTHGICDKKRRVLCKNQRSFFRLMACLVLLVYSKQVFIDEQKGRKSFTDI